MVDFDIVDGFKELLYNLGNDIANGQILDNLALLNSFNVNDIDSIIVNNITEEYNNDMIIEFILDRLARVSDTVLEKEGISITTDTLSDYNKTLSTILLIKNIDDVYAKSILTILEDDSKDNIEILSTLVSTYSDIRYTDVFDIVNYYKDINKNLLIESLDEKADKVMDTDIEGVQESFDNIKLLMSISKDMAKSDIAKRLFNGQEIKTEFKYYLDLVKDLNLNDENNAIKFEVNIATGLYFSNDTKDDVIDSLYEYITDDYLEDVVNKEEILNIILVYLKKLKDGDTNDD